MSEGRSPAAPAGTERRADPGAAAHPEPSDAELLAAHVEGDPEAFATLVARHQDRLWAVAIRTLGQEGQRIMPLAEAIALLNGEATPPDLRH